MASCQFLLTDSTPLQLLHSVSTEHPLCAWPYAVSWRTRCQNKLHEGKHVCCLQYLDECWHIVVIQIEEWMKTHMILVFRGLLKNLAQRPQSSTRACVARAYQTLLAFWVYSLHTQSADEGPEAAWLCLPEMTLSSRLEPGSAARSSIFLLYY